MLTMPFAAASCLSRCSRLLRPAALGLIAALATAVAPSVAAADTGDPSSPGYTGDVDPGAQAAAPNPADEYADNDPSALTDFRDTLDPHGTWVQDPTYGTVWVPNQAEVGSDFAPYQTGGHWDVSDGGDWMWASDYDWGWAPFHYGRWVWANSYWGWIPGRTYAPAWVTWRVGDGGYLGWAPLPPSWYWADGIAVGLWTVPMAAYCFVPTTAVFNHHVSTYVVRDRSAVQSAAASTRPYHPATPSVGHKGGVGSHPPKHGASSPTFSAAGIPASSVPRQRTAHDARALAFSKRSSSIAARRNFVPSRGTSAPAPMSRGNAWQRNYDGFGRSTGNANASGSRTLGQPSGVYDGSRGSAGFRSAPASGAHVGRQAPSFHSASPAFRSAAPAQGRYVAPPSHMAPSHHVAPSHHAAPSFHSGGASVRQAPSFSGARPSTTLSRPSSSTPRFSGGGMRGGGGRRR